MEVSTQGHSIVSNSVLRACSLSSKEVCPDALILVPYEINGKTFQLSEEQIQAHMDKKEKIKKAAEEAKMFEMTKTKSAVPAPIREQASSQSSGRKRKHMELEPEIKVPGLECNRSLPEGVPFVKFATCTLLGAALTWWNSQIRTLGPDALSMTWEVKGNDVPTYTERFQELTLICTKFVANETEKVDKYISGLPDNIYGNVRSARPNTLDETIELANDLMDHKLRTYIERQTDNKRKADDSSKNNHGHQQQPFKRQNVAKVYNMGSGKKNPYGGSLPKCTKCHFHHNGPCTQKCHKCNKVGNFAHDCRGSGNANIANAQKDNRAVPKGNSCFQCGSPRHFKRDCPKLKNKDGGNGNAQG
ncbi:reverse transcriptase domain-containing protein [Tanacetum coccineum]